jgi:DNA-binding NtrC family response regulator
VADLGLESASPSSRLRTPDTAAQEVTGPAETRLNLEEVMRQVVTVALQKTRGHKSQAAMLLGVHPRPLTRMLHRYGLPEA